LIDRGEGSVLAGTQSKGRDVADTRFRLSARVSSDDLTAARQVLDRLLPDGAVSEAEGELLVQTELAGATAKDLNRTLLSALRRAEKRTRLRAQWTSPDGTTESYFDYVLKKTTRG
jgi:hypothetical protein